MQSIEGMKELFLSALFLGEELNIIDEQYVDIAELIAEAGHLVIAQRVDHFVGELLAGEIANRSLRLVLLHHVPDRLHQVSFTHTDSSIKEERVISL